MNNYFLNITAINIHTDSYLDVCITIMTFTMFCVLCQIFTNSDKVGSTKLND